MSISKITPITLSQKYMTRAKNIAKAAIIGTCLLTSNAIINNRVDNFQRNHVQYIENKKQSNDILEILKDKIANLQELIKNQFDL